jgi:hypothetical protein
MNTTSLFAESNEETIAGTGIGDRNDCIETKMSAAATASRFEQNNVTAAPPIVETTVGDTISTEGIGIVFGSKQYVSEQTSSWTGCCESLKSKGMRPRDEQKTSKLQGRTYKNGKNEKDEAPIVIDIVEFPSKSAAGAFM